MSQDYKDLEAALQNIAPLHFRSSVVVLAQMLSGMISGTSRPEVFQEQLASDPIIMSLLQLLINQKVFSQSAVVTFGENSQSGDVNIEAIAQGDIYKISININSNYQPPSNLDHKYVSNREMSPSQEGEDFISVKYYVFLSDSKALMLSDQLGFQVENKHSNKYDLMNNIIGFLTRKELIGSIESSKPYISTTLPVKWGVVNWGVRNTQASMALFYTTGTNPLLIMGGSSYHIVGERKPESTVGASFGYSGSHLPGIIKMLSRHSGIDIRSPLIAGSINDYVFSTGLTQGKVIFQKKGYGWIIRDSRLDFPEQNLEFVARVLKRIPKLSDNDIDQALIDLADRRAVLPRRGYPEDHKRLLESIFRCKKDLLICSPLYAALSEVPYL